METSEFSAIFGVVPGFGHDDAAPEAPLERVARAWHEAAQAERARGGLYVSAALGYGAADDWGPFDDATNQAFAPLETFGDRQRLAEHLAHVETEALGFADTDPKTLIPVAGKLLR